MTELTIAKLRVQGRDPSRRWCDRWVVFNGAGQVVTQSCTTKKDAQAVVNAGLQRCQKCNGKIWYRPPSRFCDVPRWFHILDLRYEHEAAP